MEIETIPNQPSTIQASHPERAPTSEYVVEKILEKKVVNNQKLYLIKWEGYPESDCTWEPVENLLKVLDLIVDFEVRDCLMESNQDNEKIRSPEESPTNLNKRRADQSLSDEEEVTKKLKGEKSSSEYSEDEGVDREEKLTLRRKEIEEKTISSPETLKKVSEKVNITKPFTIGVTEIQAKDLINEEAVETFKRKRGRPRKPENEKLSVIKAKQDLSGTPKKRGRPLKALRGRGRPRKFPAPETEDANKEEVKTEGPKRGRGRPRKVKSDEEKVNEEGKESGEENKEKVEGAEEEEQEKDEKETELQPRKRGRPKKYDIFETYTKKYISKPTGTGKRGRPRKVQEPGEKKEEEKGEYKEGDIKLETEDTQEQPVTEQENEEEKFEDYDPLALVKARTEAVMKRRGLPVGTEMEVEGEVVEKRGRGRPRKIRDEAETEVKEGEEGVVKKRGRPPKNKNGEQNEGVNGEKSEENKEKEKLGILIEEGEEPKLKKRGRPPKPKTAEETEENAQPKKRGRPRKDREDVNKENENSLPSQNKDNIEAGKAPETAQKDQKGSVEEEAKVLELNQLNQKAGSFGLKDKPKRILKVRRLTNTGSLFFVEWEPRQNDEQPDNSYVSSYELKDHCPVFLAEFYEGLIKTNFKRMEEAHISVRKPSEEFIPLDDDPDVGSYAIGDKLSFVNKVEAIDEKGIEFWVRWQRRPNGADPLDSIVTNVALKDHDVGKLISYYESKIRVLPASEEGIVIDIPQRVNDADIKEARENNKQGNASIEEKQKESIIEENKGNEPVEGEKQSEMVEEKEKGNEMVIEEEKQSEVKGGEEKQDEVKTGEEKPGEIVTEANPSEMVTSEDKPNEMAEEGEKQNNMLIEDNKEGETNM